MNDASVADFYDHLAGDYHLLFADWDRAVQRQGEILDRLLAAGIGPAPQRVLDCSCGIGTQAIGLAQRGHIVHATDLSRAAVDRARREAARLGVPLTTGVADLRDLTQVPGTFDAVVTCDNALPHLLTDDDLRHAAREMLGKLRAGGLLVASIRDYDRFLAERPQAETPRVFDGPDGRRIVFQVWDWQADAPVYTLSHFIVTDVEGAWRTTHAATTYRALQRHELGAILAEVGFREIAWLMPEESGYYQPIVTARA